METVKLKGIRRFFNKLLNFFKMYNARLLRKTSQYVQFTEQGKKILQDVVGEFIKLNAPPDAVCKLVDNDTKLLIKFLGVWALVGSDKLQDRYGSLIIYRAKRWSLDWEDYIVPINADIQFDTLGNVYINGSLIDRLEPVAYVVLEYILEAGRKA